MKALAITPIVIIIVLVVIAAIGIVTLSTTKNAGLEEMLSGTVKCGIEDKPCCGGFYCSGGLVCSDEICVTPHLEVSFDDSKFVYNKSDFDYFEQNYNYIFLTTGTWRDDIPNDISKLDELKEECYRTPGSGPYQCYECEQFPGIENRTIFPWTNYDGRDAPYNCSSCDYCNSSTKSCERCSICTDYKFTNSLSLPGTGWQDVPDSRDSYENLTNCYACYGSEDFDESGFFAEKSTECGFCETGDVKQTVSTKFNCEYCAQFNGTNFQSCFNCKPENQVARAIGYGYFRCRRCDGSIQSQFTCKKQSEFELCEGLKRCIAESRRTGESCELLEDVPIKAVNENKFITDIQNIINTCLGKEILEPRSYEFKQRIGNIKQSIQYYEDFGQKMTSYWNCGGYRNEGGSGDPLIIGKPPATFSIPDGYYYTISVKATEDYQQNIFFCKQPTLTNNEDDPILEIPRKLREIDFSNSSTWPEGASLEVYPYKSENFTDFSWIDDIYYRKSDRDIVHIFYVYFTEPFHINMNNTQKTAQQIADAIVSGMMQWNIVNGQWENSSEELCKEIENKIHDLNVKMSIYPPGCKNATIIRSMLNVTEVKSSATVTIITEKTRFNTTWSLIEKNEFKNTINKCWNASTPTIIYSCNIGADCYKNDVYILPRFSVIYQQNLTCKYTGNYPFQCYNTSLSLVPVFGIAESENDVKNICDMS